MKKLIKKILVNSIVLSILAAIWVFVFTKTELSLATYPSLLYPALAIECLIFGLFVTLITILNTSTLSA